MRMIGMTGMIAMAGMTGVTWEDTPDGRPGWQMAFLRAGHDVYVSDAVERGRASWCCLPDIYADAPIARTKQECWEGFRLGPAASRQRPSDF